MMSPTGNKREKCQESGFSLIEVMLTVVVLTLIVLTIYPSNLLSLGVYGEYMNRLNIQNWAEEKMWETKEKILQSDAPEAGENTGELHYRNKTYRWRIEIQETDLKDFYTILLDIDWAGRREASLSRTTSVRKREK